MAEVLQDAWETHWREALSPRREEYVPAGTVQAVGDERTLSLTKIWREAAHQHRSELSHPGSAATSIQAEDAPPARA